MVWIAGAATLATSVAIILLAFPLGAHAALTDGLVGHWTFNGKDTVK